MQPNASPSQRTAGTTAIDRAPVDRAPGRQAVEDDESLRKAAFMETALSVVIEAEAFGTIGRWSKSGGCHSRGGKSKLRERNCLRANARAATNKKLAARERF